MLITMSAKASKTSDNKQKVHEFTQKFRAWWNGVEYTPDATDSEAMPQEPNPQPATEIKEVAKPQESKEYDSSRELVEDKIEEQTLDKIMGESAYVPNPENQEANTYFVSERIFGEGRLAPTDGEVDKAIIAGMPFTSAKRKQKLSIFGAQAAASIYAWQNRYDIDIEAYEADKFIIDKTKAFLNDKNPSGKIKFHNYDNSPKTVPKNRADQLLVYAQATTIKKFEETCFSIARILTPEGQAVWVDYFAKDGCEDIAADSIHGRNFIYESEIFPLMDACGLKVAEDEDISVHLLNSYYARQARILEDWEKIQQDLISHGGVEVARIALNMTIAWKKRIDAIRRGHLFLKRLKIILD